MRPTSGELANRAKPAAAGGTDRQGGRAKSPQKEIVRRFEHEARTFLAGAAARLDGIERVTAEPEAPAHATVVKQSVLLRSARSLALPVLLLALGTGTAIVMLSPVGERPRGQMKEAKPQAPVASPRSVAEAAASSALELLRLARPDSRTIGEKRAAGRSRQKRACRAIGRGVDRRRAFAARKRRARKDASTAIG